MKWRQVVRRKDVNLFCSQLLSFSNFFRENIRLIEYIGLWGWVHWHLVPMKFVGWPFMLTMPAWQPLSTPNYYLIFQTGHVSLALASFTERVCVFIYLFIYEHVSSVLAVPQCSLYSTGMSLWDRHRFYFLHWGSTCRALATKEAFFFCFHLNVCSNCSSIL